MLRVGDAETEKIIKIFINVSVFVAYVIICKTLFNLLLFFFFKAITIVPIYFQKKIYELMNIKKKCWGEKEYKIIEDKLLQKLLFAV